jgi:hypothetical protein
MTTFTEFTQVAPIDEATIERFAPLVDEQIVDLWRRQGAGFAGQDGFVRVVDPARAALMLDGVVGLPDGSVVLFTTGMGDVIFTVNGAYLACLFRWGAIDVAPSGTSFADLVALLESDAGKRDALDWAPYPEAVARDGVPAFEQCFGFVPLLALGGRADAEHLRLGGLYEHIAVIAKLAGMPKVRGQLAVAG